MKSKKKYKVIVVGLPKTGTSTLAVMLRMLGYRVTGPNSQYKIGDFKYLNQLFEEYDGFQDFPWCFEWQRYFDDTSVKFIILKRNPESWWDSFFESYGNKNGYYISKPYFKLNKTIENKVLFLKYFKDYYESVLSMAERNPERFLVLDIRTFQWKELCDFLDEKVPKDLFGRAVKKPHVNKEKYKLVSKRSYRVTSKIRLFIVKIAGKDSWNQMIIFLRKNRIV